MSNYWAIVMWMSDVSGEDIIYIPSNAHYADRDCLEVKLGPYNNWEDAMMVAIGVVETVNPPTFTPCRASSPR